MYCMPGVIGSTRALLLAFEHHKDPGMLAHKPLTGPVIAGHLLDCRDYLFRVREVVLSVSALAGPHAVMPCSDCYIQLTVACRSSEYMVEMVILSKSSISTCVCTERVKNGFSTRAGMSVHDKSDSPGFAHARAAGK